MNKRINIRLYGIEDVKHFVAVVSAFQSDVNVITKDGQIIDAKSILGLFSINLLQDVTVEIITDDVAEYEDFKNKIREFER